jgi:hypothetical protein
MSELSGISELVAKLEKVKQNFRDIKGEEA